MKQTRALLLCLTILFIAKSDIHSQILSGTWDERFCPCGADWVDLVSRDSDKFIMGGWLFQRYYGIDQFTGKKYLPQPVVWDGKEWSSLGGGVTPQFFDANSLYSQINAIIPRDNDIYIAGGFIKAGTVASNGLARWNKVEQKWYDLSTGLTPSENGGFRHVSVYTVFVDSENIFASGNFTINDTGICYIARLSSKDSLWHNILSAGNILPVNYHYAQPLCYHAGKLFVGDGFFAIIDSTLYRDLMYWDVRDEKWHNLQDSFTVNVAQYASLRVLPAEDSGIYVSGDFFIKKQGSDSVLFNNIAKWDGQKWVDPLRGTTILSKDSLTASSDNGILYVTGNISFIQNGDTLSKAVSFDGKIWKQILPELKNASKVSSRQIFQKANDWYVAGLTAENIPVLSPFGRWNGRFLTYVDSGTCLGLNGQNNAFEVTAFYRLEDTIIIGGDFSKAGGVAVNGLAAWDGSVWHDVGSGLPAYFGKGVTSITKYKDELYVGGNFTVIIGKDTIEDLVKWNGSRWVLPFDSIKFRGNINALAVHNDSLIIGGRDFQYGDTVYNFLACWHGNHLTQLGELTPDSIFQWTNGAIYVLCDIGNTLFAGGNFYGPLQGKPINNIAKWSGSEWLPLGTLDSNGVGDTYSASSVLSLSGKNDTLVIGGHFDRVCGQPAKGLAIYDGNSVEPIQVQGTGGNTISAVYYDQGKIFFYTYDEGSSPLFPSPGCFIDNKVYRLGNYSGNTIPTAVSAITKNNLGEVSFVGNIERAAGKPSYGLAIWHPSSLGVNEINHVNGLLATIIPNPAASEITIYLPSQPSTKYISISDALGREIASFKPNGESIQYDVSQLANGVYYCTVQSAAGRETRKFVVSH